MASEPLAHGRTKGAVARIETPRDRLRVATAHAHEEVDALFSRFDLADQQSYRLFLEAHQHVLPACEKALDRAGAQILLADWPSRRRSAVLSLDLDNLGSDKGAGNRLVTVSSAAEAWGLLYVLEGSRLGGTVLARRVAEIGDHTSVRATRYLRHGEGQRLWPTFVAALNSSKLVQDRLPEVITAAIAGFSLFKAAAEAVHADHSRTDI